MLDKATKIIFSIVLTAAVLTGGLLAYQRHVIESASKTVELVMDWRDIQTLSALSKYPTDKLLTDIKARGITSIGLFEETLNDAAAMGEIYHAGGSGILRIKALNPILSDLVSKREIKPEKTYLLSYNPEIRKRIMRQLHYTLPNGSIRNIGEKVIELDESEIMLKDIGVGMSEAVRGYLIKKGFSIVPRVSNDPRYDVEGKISELAGSSAIIFDGEEILGYPDKINVLAKAMKKNGIKYGNVEIVKQNGDKKLKHLMGDQVVRVHSIPKDELLKVNKDEALIRFSRAVKERSIRLIYVRPFLPPQIAEDPIKYHLQYLSEIKTELEEAGYQMGKASAISGLQPAGWQIIVIGLGVAVILLLLIDQFISVPWYLMWLVFILSPFVMVAVGAESRGFMLEKTLAFLAAVSVPAYAVISQYSRKDQVLASGNVIINSILMMMNALAECAIGIFLITGLFANTRFMLGAEEFIGIKLALILPVLIVILYFIPRSKEKALDFLNQKISMLYILIALMLIGVFGVLLARSGNFTLPVPGFEKYARQLLETVLGIRPRTKEFLIGYPFLIMAGILFLKSKKEWLWILLAIGVIGPISLINSFTHIHSPLLVSLMRSINGLALGVIIGAIAGAVYLKLGKK